MEGCKPPIARLSARLSQLHSCGNHLFFQSPPLPTIARSSTATVFSLSTYNELSQKLNNGVPNINNLIPRTILSVNSPKPLGIDLTHPKYTLPPISKLVRLSLFNDFNSSSGQNKVCKSLFNLHDYILLLISDINQALQFSLLICFSNS